MYLSFIWTSREQKTCSFGDKATNSEANSVRCVRFFSIFSSGRLIDAFVLPRIVQNIAIFSVEIGGWAFIRAWASIRDFTVLVIPRNRWLCLNMTEKLFTGTLNKNNNKKKIFEPHLDLYQSLYDFFAES